VRRLPSGSLAIPKSISPRTIAQVTTRSPIIPALAAPYWYYAPVNARAVNKLELSSPEAVERFRKAAKAFTTRSIKSQAAARKVLVDEGIYTKSGKLTKRYSYS
jgi:hypothetical protein